jgi:hypothetical protein
MPFHPAGATLLPSMTQLLAGICTVVADAPAGTPADAQVRRAAFGCLYTLVLLLHAAYVGSQTPPAHRLLPTVEAATSLAFLLVNGVTYSGQEGSSCSCCLDGRRQAASGPPAAHQLLVRGEGLGSLLGPLAQLHGCAANQDGTFEADRLALVSRGAYALDLQHLALQLAAARKARRRGARRTPPAAATPSCANLSAFFVTGQPDDSVALRCPADPHQLLLLTVNAVMTLTAIIDPLKCAQACPHCTPEQMLLLLEASTQHCQLDFDLATGQDLLLSISSLHDEVLHLRAGAPWMPEFRRRAAPTLSAFVAAAAQQLSGSQGAAGAGSSRSGAVCRSDLALAAQYAARMLACGGGLLEAPGEGDWALVERLLPCLEPVVRCLDACMQADGELCLNILTVSGGLVVWFRAAGHLPARAWQWACSAPQKRRLTAPAHTSAPGARGRHAHPPAVSMRHLPCSAQAVVIHTPDTFDELWRSGCLPGLIVTTAKLSGVEEGDEEGSEEWDGDGGEGWGLAQLMAARPLLSAVLPAPGQAQPWFAASAERQQFTLLALGRIGAKAAAVVQGQGMRVGLEGLLAMATDLLQLAAGQLSGQPLLRQQLEAAAPKLLQQAANMKAELRLPPSVDGQPRAPMMLLAALAQQLDPLALGLALPGCYNPACTSLAGASEAGMPLKTCMGCKTARWAYGLVCMGRA